MEIRETIYEDEINNMIMAVNHNHEANVVIMTQLLGEN